MENLHFSSLLPLSLHAPMFWSGQMRKAVLTADIWQLQMVRIYQQWGYFNQHFSSEGFQRPKQRSAVSLVVAFANVLY